MRNNDHQRILGMMDVESDKLNAFGEEDRQFSGARRRPDRALFALARRARPSTLHRWKHSVEQALEAVPFVSAKSSVRETSDEFCAMSSR